MYLRTETDCGDQVIPYAMHTRLCASQAHVMCLTAEKICSAYAGDGLYARAIAGLHGGCMFHKKTIAISIAAMLLFACIAAMATTNKMGIAENQTIEFTAPTLV